MQMDVLEPMGVYPLQYALLVQTLPQYGRPLFENYLLYGILTLQSDLHS